MAPSYLQRLFKYSIEVVIMVAIPLNRLYVPQVQTNYGRQSLHFRVTILWNNLSPSLYSASSLADFRRSYHDLNIKY